MADQEEKIYRYISFESFIDIVQTNSLTFVSPLDAWEDTYEGFLFRAMKTEKGRAEILKYFDENYKHLFETENVAKLVKFLCWSYSRDEVAMWSIYSYGNKAIMIQTSKSKVCMLKNSKGESVEGQDVSYLDEISVEKEAGHVMTKGSVNVAEVFLTKRKAFSHEHEWRSFVSEIDGGDFSRIERIAHPVKIHFNSDCQYNDFIEDVLVHPNAPDWYVNVVKTFCEINEICFSGKSKLYDFEYNS